MRESAYEKNNDMPSDTELKRLAKQKAKKAEEIAAKTERDYQQEKKNLCQPFFDDPIEFITKAYLNDKGRTQFYQFQLLTTLVKIQQSLESLISVLKARK